MIPHPSIIQKPFSPLADSFCARERDFWLRGFFIPAPSTPFIPPAMNSKPLFTSVLRIRISVLLALAAGGVLAPCARAADGSWNVNAAGNWATEGSWLSSTIPGATSGNTSTDIATFGFTLTGARIVTVDTGRNIGGITFSNTSAYGYTLSGGTLILSNGGVIQTAAANGAHTDTISTGMTLAGNATFMANASNASSLLSIAAVTGSATTEIGRAHV
jgi:hypothetical protein